MYKLRLSPPPYVNIGDTKTFTVIGKALKKVTAVYLSGSPYPDATLYAPFSGVPKLSANYPPFYAVKVPADSYVTDNYYTFTFTVPSASDPGIVDVILQNPAGYGSVTSYAAKKFNNPFLSGTDLYDTYQTYKKPWEKGITVSPKSVVTTAYVPAALPTFTPQLTTDTDLDGYTDEVELSAGTDTNNLTSFPVSLFNVFNQI